MEGGGRRFAGGRWRKEVEGRRVGERREEARGRALEGGGWREESWKEEGRGGERQRQSSRVNPSVGTRVCRLRRETGFQHSWP